MRLDDMHWRQERIVSIIQTMDRKISKKMDVKKKKKSQKDQHTEGYQMAAYNYILASSPTWSAAAFSFLFYYNMDNTDQESCTQYVG